MSQGHIDNIFWAVHLDSRSFCKQTSGNVSSDLKITISLLAAGMMPNMMNVPYSKLPGSSPEERPPKKRRVEVVPTKAVCSDTPWSQSAHGAMEGYNPILKAQWKNTTAELGPNPVIKELLKGVKQPGGRDNWTLRALNVRVADNRCMVGTITGTCSNPRCTHSHSISSNDSQAGEISKIIEAATIKAKSG